MRLEVLKKALYAQKYLYIGGEHLKSGLKSIKIFSSYIPYLYFSCKHRNLRPRFLCSKFPIQVKSKTHLFSVSS